MNKKHSNMLLFLSILFLTAVISAVATANFDLLINVFGNLSAAEKTKANLILFCLVLLLVVWVLLLYFFAEMTKAINLSGLRSTDPLTGLGNKKQLRLNYDSINHDKRRFSCLCYLEFNVRKVRALHGSALADDLQRTAAEILSGACGDYDCASRIGDGEFAVSLFCRNEEAAVNRISDVIIQLNRFQRRILFEDYVPFYAGIFFANKERVPFEKALTYARAGYRVARETKRSYVVSTKDLIEKESGRDRLRERLDTAIDDMQFEIYLQFIYDVKGANYPIAEVLSRWNRPGGGLLLPSQFFADLKTTGIIGKFDLFMLDRVCEILQKWKTTEMKDIVLSCNITRVTISSPDFLDNFRYILRKYDFEHDHLILEITEDALIDDPETARKNIVSCRESGIRIAIDDFGAGHTSLSDISDFPVDQVKIDRRLVNKSAEEGSPLLNGLVLMAHELRLEVVCEGVETQQQKDYVLKSHSDFIQGFLYSKVMSLPDAEGFFRSHMVPEAAQRSTPKPGAADAKPDPR